MKGVVILSEKSSNEGWGFVFVGSCVCVCSFRTPIRNIP